MNTFIRSVLAVGAFALGISSVSFASEVNPASNQEGAGVSVIVPQDVWSACAMECRQMNEEGGGSFQACMRECVRRPQQVMQSLSVQKNGCTAFGQYYPNETGYELSSGEYGTVTTYICHNGHWDSYAGYMCSYYHTCAR